MRVPGIRADGENATVRHHAAALAAGDAGHRVRLERSLQVSLLSSPRTQPRLFFISCFFCALVI
jgi:hypothetical protein